MKTYSLDLREKVVATVDEGKLSLRAIAALFKVSFTWVKKLLRQRREQGNFAPLPHGGGQKPRLDEEKLALLREVVAGKPDATLDELCRKVKPANRRAVSRATMCRTLNRLGFTRKKKGNRSRRAQ